MYVRTAIATLAFALGCGASSPPDVEQTPAASDVADMHRHFDDITRIQSSLIGGDIAQAQLLAIRMRAGFDGGSAETWQPFVARLQALATSLRFTKDLAEAARLTATMAFHCGDCHRSQRMRARASISAPPSPVGDALQDFMVQHRWAADRMWEGLIAPSDRAWSAGTAILANQELSGEMFQEYGTARLESALLRVREVAQMARDGVKRSERHLFYGEYLATCAACHAAISASHEAAGTATD